MANVEHESIELGAHLRQNHFMLSNEHNFTNNGSYGSTPKHIFNKRLQYQQEMESAPDIWFRYTSYELWNRSIKSLTQFLSVDDEHLVLCDNATDAINAALKSIDFVSSSQSIKHCILANEFTYKAILNSIDYTSKYRLQQQQQQQQQVHVEKMPLVLPIESKQQLIDEYDRTINDIVNVKQLNLRLVVIDHISSVTAILYPIRELIQVVKKYTQQHDNDPARKCFVLIDGAHCIGHTAIELNELGCDFYASNLHKWFFAPRGCSFLYFRDLEHAKANLQPNFISWGYEGSLRENFFLRATNDKTSHYLVDECIAFHVALGGLNRIAAYCCDLVDRASEMLISEWKTEKIPIDSSVQAPFMRLIKLPDLECYAKLDVSAKCDKLMKELMLNYKTVAVVVSIHTQCYVRISAFVYNTINDYIKLKDAILDISINK